MYYLVVTWLGKAHIIFGTENIMIFPSLLFYLSAAELWLILQHPYKQNYQIMLSYIIMLALRHFIKLGSCSTTRKQNKLSYAVVSLNWNRQMQRFLHYLCPFLTVFLTILLSHHFQRFQTLFLLQQNNTKSLHEVPYLLRSRSIRQPPQSNNVFFSPVSNILPTIMIHLQSFRSLMLDPHLINSSHQKKFSHTCYFSLHLLT